MIKLGEGKHVCHPSPSGFEEVDPSPPSIPCPFFILLLNQGHLHPKLEVPRLTCFGREFHGGRPAFKQRALYSDRTLISIPNIYI
jgi:hypothetical protein